MGLVDEMLRNESRGVGEWSIRHRETESFLGGLHGRGTKMRGEIKSPSLLKRARQPRAAREDFRAFRWRGGKCSKRKEKTPGIKT